MPNISVNTKPFKVDKLTHHKFVAEFNEINPKVIDFILLGIALDMVYVTSDRKGIKTNIKNGYVIDTLLTTINDKLYLSGLEFFPECNGLKFSELPIYIQRKINDFEFVVSILNPTTDSEIINFVK